MPLLTVSDIEAEAVSRLSEPSLAFISGGAGEELTLARNIDAFDDIELVPRILRDVSRRSTATTVLGVDIDLPVLIAPSAMHRMLDPDGEIATASAAHQSGTILVLSLGSSYPVESVMSAQHGPVWFQVYVGKDRARTADVIERASSAGCAALVVTVDAPVVGGRATELRAGFEVEAEWFADGHEPMYGLTEPVASGAGATTLWDPSLTWDDLDWLRGVSDMPLVIKGLLSSEDASLAVSHGVDAVIVSNHGGRQLDGAAPTIDVLPSIVDAVGDAAEVLLDGGVRRGSDVLKGLALGARAVLVGRPAMWGLAARGATGVTDVLAILARELDLAMALCGARSIEEISADLLRRRSAQVLSQRDSLPGGA